MSELTDEIVKALNDVEEDHREEGESIAQEPDTQTTNDIAEDHREEGESLEDLKEALKTALYDNSVLKAENERLTKERDDAHNAFLNSSKEVKKNERSYNSILGDMK